MISDPITCDNSLLIFLISSSDKILEETNSAVSFPFLIDANFKKLKSIFFKKNILLLTTQIDKKFFNVLEKVMTSDILLITFN